jgi:hypothetical protein
VKIDARAPDADPEKEARPGTYIKSIHFPFLLARSALEGLTGLSSSPASPPSQLPRLEELVAATAWSGAIRSLLLRHLAERPIGKHR